MYALENVGQQFKVYAGIQAEKQPCIKTLQGPKLVGACC